MREVGRGSEGGRGMEGEWEGRNRVGGKEIDR